MHETLLLTGDDYDALVSMDDCIAAVEDAFRAYGERRLHAGLLSEHAERGAFHVKTSTDGRYFAAKLNANFPGSVPSIQGVLILMDATNGAMLALIDSIAVTRQRTAAATAVAAKYLARRDAKTAMIVGCGTQGAAQLAALRRVLPLDDVSALDVDRERAARFGVRVVDDIQPADVIVTCTPSRKAFLRREHLRAGTFVAAVGADSPQKSEIDPEAMRASVVVADVLEQAATIGDLRVAIAAGAMTRDGVAELGAIVAGLAPGRQDDAETIIFDSTGAGFQDAAAAAMAYERALAAGRGTRINFRGNG